KYKYSQPYRRPLGSYPSLVHQRTRDPAFAVPRPHDVVVDVQAPAIAQPTAPQRRHHDFAVRCDPVLVRHQSIPEGAQMFVVEEFIIECKKALTENEPRKAIREVVTRAVSDSSSVANALEHHHAGITLLHNT